MAHVEHVPTMTRPRVACRMKPPVPGLRCLYKHALGEEPISLPGETPSGTAMLALSRARHNIVLSTAFLST